MFEELETVILNHDIGAYHLKKGALGTIVHVYENGKAFETEFVTLAGKTIAVLTLTPADISSIEVNERLSICGNLENFEFAVFGTTASSIGSSLQTNQQRVEIITKSDKSKESFFCYPTI